MPYEVIKRINGRPYRYQVESYRDPETRRVKKRWTYVGKAAEGDEAPPQVRHRSPDTKERIVRAFLDLVDRASWNEVTPGAVVAQAGLAHGTFYRYFRNREDLLDHCAAEANAALSERLELLDNVAPDMEDERARLRAWIGEYLGNPTVRPGLLRVLIESGPAHLERVRADRRRARLDAFTRYIERLRECGFAPSEGTPAMLATTLSMLLELLARRTAIEDAILSEDDFAGTAEAFDRMVFWLPPSRG